MYNFVPIRSAKLQMLLAEIVCFSTEPMSDGFFLFYTLTGNLMRFPKLL